MSWKWSYLLFKHPDTLLIIINYCWIPLTCEICTKKNLTSKTFLRPWGWGTSRYLVSRTLLVSSPWIKTQLQEEECQPVSSISIKSFNFSTSHRLIQSKIGWLIDNTTSRRCFVWRLHSVRKTLHCHAALVMQQNLFTNIRIVIANNPIAIICTDPSTQEIQWNLLQACHSIISGHQGLPRSSSASMPFAWFQQHCVHNCWYEWDTWYWHNILWLPGHS